MSEKRKVRSERDRLAEQEFRKAISARGVVEELRGLKLWRDGKSELKEPGGFSFDDLWAFSAAFMIFGESSRRARDLRKNAHRLAEKAEHLREGVRALQWARQYGLEAPNRGWFEFSHFDVRAIRDYIEHVDVPVDQRRQFVIVVGDLEGAMLRYADRIERYRVIAVRRHDPLEALFRTEWKKLALEKTGGRNCLDGVGADLLGISFGRWLSEGAYRKARQRDPSRPAL